MLWRGDARRRGARRGARGRSRAAPPTRPPRGRALRCASPSSAPASSASPRPTSSRPTATRSRCSSAAAASPPRQLRQRRRGRAGLRHALGGAGHAGQGAALAARPRTRRCASAAARRRATLGWMWRWWRACKPEPIAPTARACTASRTTAASGCTSSRRAWSSTTNAAAASSCCCAPARAGAGASPGSSCWPSSAWRSQLLDAAARRAVEPGLNPDAAARGRPPAGRRGRQLPRSSRSCCKRGRSALGARFRFDESSDRAGAAELGAARAGRDDAASRGRATGARAESERAGFDAVVVCAALDSARLLAPLGVRLPLAPVHGYSVTAPLRHDDAHPDSGRARR